MKAHVLLLLTLAFSGLSAPSADVSTLKQKAATKIEQLAERMFPKKDLDEMLGFFGPVTKKYMPVFQQFNAEYLAGTNKLATVRKYLPRARAALEEAQAMKVPPKYEAKKAEYLGKVGALVTVLNLTARFEGR